VKRRPPPFFSHRFIKYLEEFKDTDSREEKNPNTDKEKDCVCDFESTALSFSRYKKPLICFHFLSSMTTSVLLFIANQD
jgi:hypothetical protein